MIIAPFTTPFYTGSGVTAEVPGLFPMAIDGYPYFLDLTSSYYRPRFQRSSITLLRSQADIGQTPTEGSMNPDDLWRRPDETWHKGAGQVHLDRPDSDQARFHSSKGINPWTKWQVSLLPDTANKKAGSNTNLYLVVAGSRVYVTDGNNIAYTTDITGASPTWTNLTGIPAANPTSICSDGYNVYSSHSASGIYLTNTGSGATAQWINPGTVTLVRYVKGRLMAAAANNLYNVITSTSTAGPTALPTALYTHPNPQWTWVDITEGQGQIYAAGYAGDKSLIYRTAIKSDGTALDIPVVAGELPDGEVVRAIQGYLGFLVIGTDLGVRFAAVDGQGNLTVGALIRTAPCMCLEPQDRFVWFGWNNYDSVSTGLGRLDLSTFTAPLTPAYASDLMASTQGSVLSVVTALQGTPTQELRVFSVSGVGVFSQTSNLVASGTLDSGQITYGIFDKKFACFLDVRTMPIVNSSYQAYLSVDDGAFTSIGASISTDTLGRIFAIGPQSGRKFEVRMQLVRDSSTATLGPTITRNTLRSYPAPRRVDEFVLPIILHETLDLGYAQISMDVKVALNRLIQIAQDRRTVILQLGSESFNILIEDYQYHPHHPTKDQSYWNGWCIIRAKTIITE